jgi:hypothetical protein
MVTRERLCPVKKKLDFPDHNFWGEMLVPRHICNNGSYAMADGYRFFLLCEGEKDKGK